MNDAARLLGFAFANADFLFEVDMNGTVTFATGAASDFVRGDASIVGKPAARLFSTAESTKFATLSRTLGTGSRAGPFRLKLAGGTDAALSLFRLPGNGNQISCTLSKPGLRAIASAASTDPKTGLADRDGFLAAAAKMAGENDALALFNLPGLPDLSEAESDRLLGSIGAALGKLGAKAAGRVSKTSFCIIADAVGGMDKLAGKIRAALAEAGAASLAVEETLVSLKGKGISDAQRDMVMRYVVDKFAGGQWSGDALTDAAAQFGKMVEETQSRLRMMTETVADGAFRVVYQPIVNLKTGETSHFEALSRFDGAETGEAVAFIEALGVSDALDLAVAVKILALVESKASQGQSIAFNISGRTICTASNFGLLAGLLARKRALAARLLIEITESAEITNLDDAAKAVAALRELGFRVGLDDFGAGAAALSYLHALPVDFVKFDGALIAKIGQSKRDDILLGGMVKLCGELGIQTVAERLETPEQAAAAKAMGFDLGQGFCYGGAVPDLPPQGTKLTAKRKGVQESWG